MQRRPSFSKVTDLSQEKCPERSRSRQRLFLNNITHFDQSTSFATTINSPMLRSNQPLKTYAPAHSIKNIKNRLLEVQSRIKTFKKNEQTQKRQAQNKLEQMQNSLEISSINLKRQLKLIIDKQTKKINDIEIQIPQSNQKITYKPLIASQTLKNDRLERQIKRIQKQLTDKLQLLLENKINKQINN